MLAIYLYSLPPPPLPPRGNLGLNLWNVKPRKMSWIRACDILNLNRWNKEIYQLFTEFKKKYTKQF